MDISDQDVRRVRRLALVVGAETNRVDPESMDSAIARCFVCCGFGERVNVRARMYTYQGRLLQR
jgi:hypothetical protein